MNSLYLPLLGGVIDSTPRHLPSSVIHTIKTYRQACRLAWKLRRVTGLTKRSLAEQAGLYASHVTDYFSINEARRELPAKHVAHVEKILGNTVISQWLAWQADLTVLEELRAERKRA